MGPLHVLTLKDDAHLYQVCVLPQSLHATRFSRFDYESQQPKDWEGAIPALDAAIEASDLAHKGPDLNPTAFFL